MPVPHSLADLSTEETINSPQGGDSVGGQIDDYFRGHAVIIKRDLAPALTAAGTTVTPTGAVTATNAQDAIAALDTRATATNAALASGLSGKAPISGSLNYIQNDTPAIRLALFNSAGNDINISFNNTDIGKIWYSGNLNPSSYQLGSTAWNTSNFNPSTKADKSAQVQRQSGTVEFGEVNLDSVADTAADIPAPYAMTGLRRFTDGTNTKHLYLRGCIFQNQ